MAVRTSTQSGNTHSAPFAFGTTVNDGDQLQVTNSAHAINFDQSCAIGISLCETQQVRPTTSVTGSTGNLPAGTYRARIAAVGSTGITTASAPSNSIVVTGTPPTASFPRITLPALPAGATSWNVYLTNTGGATGTERLYATGKSEGTFDCTSASWMDGSDTYANATALPFGDAFGYATNVTAHSGGITFADNVTVTTKGDFLILGDCTLGEGSILESDPTSSPSGLGVYACPGFGTVNGAGTGKLIFRGSSSSRAIVRGKSGTTPPRIKPSPQFSGSAAMRFDLEWGRFSNIEFFDILSSAAYVHLMTDVVVDADCGYMEFRLSPATGGWNLTRVSFLQTGGGKTTSGRSCSVIFPNIDVSTGQQLCTNCAFMMPVAINKGGALWDECYFHNTWSGATGGTGTAASEIRNCFLRKLQADAVGGITAPATTHNTTDNFLYHDWITGGGTDTNPWGVGLYARGVGTTGVHHGWVVEYNGSAGGGDALFPDNSSGTLRYENNLILPNAGNGTSGNICTNNNLSNTALKIEILHNTYVGENNGLVTSEGGLCPAGIISKHQSNLIYSPLGVSTSRYAAGIAAGADGSGDTLDALDPANTGYNAGWNLINATGNWTGAYGFYKTRFSTDPTAHDIDLGSSAGADLSTNGPKFVDPTRRFHTWAEIVLGATGTTTQKIEHGLDALKAIADTTSADHVVGLEMTDPYDWVQAGFKVKNTLLKDAGHDGATIGAMEFFDSADTTPPTLVSKTISTDGQSITLVFDEPVTGSTGFTLTASGGAVTMTYASGSGTDTLVFTLSRPIQAGETVTIGYTP